MPRLICVLVVHLLQKQDFHDITRIWVVSALGRFGLGRFGQFLGWVVSALVGGSFRPIFEVSRFGPGSFRPKSIETIKI